MINLVVAGAGEGTYKNLYPVTQSKDPDLRMRIAVIMDKLPQDKLHPKMQEIIESEKIIYRQTDRLWEKFPDPENLAGVVMAPNEWHLYYTDFFTSLGMPVYIEKPVVTNLRDLQKFLEIAARYPQLVYAAEYCVDGKGRGGLAAAGVIHGSDWGRSNYLSIRSNTSLYGPTDEEVSPDSFHSFMRGCGRLKSVHGKLLEGEGTAGVADHRKWLLDGVHGGMIRDLASHLFGVLYDMGLAGTEMIEMHVTLGRWEEWMPRGTFRPLKNPEEGETYAAIEGKFLTPYGTPDFKMEVGKYWEKHDRELVLEFEEGRAQLNYEKPYLFTIENSHGLKIEARLTADFYPTLAFLDFKRFVEGKTHGHIGRAAAIVRFNETAREAGLVQAGLN